MKRRVANLLSLKLSMFFVFLLAGTCFSFAARAQNEFIVKQITPDSAGNLILITGNGNQNFEYKTIRLSNPDRLVVDINNSILAGQRRSIKINNEKIKELRIAQFSTEPKQVRLVLTSDSAEALKNIKINKNKNTLLFDINKITSSTTSNSPLYKDREPEETNIKIQDLILPVNIDEDKTNDLKIHSEQNKEAILKSLQDKIEHNIVLKNIRQYGNRIIISGTGVLSITEPIILNNPDRIAFDLSECKVDSDKLLQSINLQNGDFLRIGQFDNNTVRIVIETQKPEAYKTIISPDMQSLVIAPENEISFLEFPDSKGISEVQHIKVFKKDKKTTKVLLTCTKPIIHNIKHYKDPNEILNLEIYNLKFPPKEILEHLPKTGQFHGIMFEQIEKHPKGSKWIIPLNRTTKIHSKLSIDGKMLEITLQDVMPAMTKSDSRPKIVIDAGHGGQEPGAIRTGIYEKNITIDLAQRVKLYLKNNGINVIMTREADETVSLKQRTAITNSENPDAFVSIHINSSENSEIRGLETYYFTPQSKELAQSVRIKMANYIKSPDRGIRTARFYVIRNTEVPAILAEVGYLSNASERSAILTEERKDATAKAIAEGILNYLRSKK